MGKSQSKRAQQKQQAALSRIPHPHAPVPKSVVNAYGTKNAVLTLCETADTLSAMNELFRFSQTRGGVVSAQDALSVYCTNSQLGSQQMPLQNQQHQFNPNLPPHMQGQGQGQPQFGGAPPNNYLSPAYPNHANLPGTQPASPATLSNHNTPAMQNMHLQSVPGQPGPGSMAAPAGIPMSHQVSHQGTNPSAAGTPSALAGSANASPNVGAAGKRRRHSGINDDDINGPTVNGIGSGTGGTNAGTQKVKQSPRPGKKGRPNG